MSSHDMSVRASLDVKPEVTLKEVCAALHRFMEAHENDFEPDAWIPSHGEIPFASPEDTVSLDQRGQLHMCLSCTSGTGAPSELDSLLEALDGLVEHRGGVVEVVDHDTSASNAEAIITYFVGDGLATRSRARLDHGLDQAKEWLIDVLGVDGFDRVVSLAGEIGEERIAAAHDDKEVATPTPRAGA